MNAGKAKRLLPVLVLVAVLAGGAALRLDFALHAVALGGDQNTPALMALHISEGRDLPLYFYGQHYMGGIEPYVMAAAFSVFGPTDFAFSLAMVVFSMLWMWALYLLFGRLIGPWAGVVAAAVVAFGTPALLNESLARTGYISTFAYGTLLIYLGVRLNDPDLSAGIEWGCLLGMAALAGLSVWTNPLVLPYLLVGFGLLVVRVARMRLGWALTGKLAVSFLLLLLTLAPVVATAARYGLGALFGFRPPRLSLVPEVTALITSRYVPDLFRETLEAPVLLRWGLGVAYLAPLVVLIGGGIAALVRRNRRLVRAALVPVLVTLVYVPLVFTNPLAAAYNPRYFLVFTLLMATTFAYPFAFRRAWVSWLTAALAAIIAAGNVTACIGAGRGDSGRHIAERRAIYGDIVQRASKAGVRHVMHDSIESHALNWIGREQVVFAQPWGERYYPYLDSAIANDDAGFYSSHTQAAAFRETLRTVGVTAYKDLTGPGWTIFHALTLPARPRRAVTPVAASLSVDAEAPDDAAALIDQADETTVGARYDAAASLVVDFGQPTPISAIRFVAPDEWDFPTGYTLSGSADGEIWWVIQTVRHRNPDTCIYGSRLFHRGPLTAMECRFEPVPIRFLKIAGLQAPADHVHAWRFQEAYFYAAVPAETDKAAGAAHPTEDDAVEIARVLRGSGVAWALCDPWLSAKIKATRQTYPAVLPYYSWRHRETHRSRILPVSSGIAVVVENAHAGQVIELLRHATLEDVRLDTRTIGHYTAVIITSAPDGYESFPGLRWNGFTLVRTARVATAAWYYRHGRMLRSASQVHNARSYFERSFTTYPGILENLHQITPESHAAVEVLRSITPQVEARCRFPYGISLAGYTLSRSPLVPGEPATLRLVWELEGEIPHDYLPVFVHFTDGNAIVFQADHNVRFPCPPRTTVPHCTVADEHTFTVPAGCPEGTYAIELGATVWSDTDTRLKVRTRLPQHERAVTVGTITVGHE